MNPPPPEVAEFLADAKLTRNTTGYSHATVDLVEKPSGRYYLKTQKKVGTTRLRDDLRNLKWIEGKVPAPRPVLYADDGDYEYLVVTEVEGYPAYDETYRSQRSAAIEEVARALRLIHDLDTADCEVHCDLDDRLRTAEERVRQGLVEEDHFEAWNAGKTARELFGELLQRPKPPVDPVFAHGDFCLPNILLNGGRLSGVIDWGGAGIADRYQDLALVYRSLVYNQFTEEQIKLFFRTYGIEELDRSKVDYYILLDEFF